MKLENQILELTQSLLKNIKSTGFTRGGEFSELDGSYFCDCSSYITSLLKIISPEFYGKLLLNESRLKAIDYFDMAIDGSRGVDSHRDISKLCPGEVLVWKKTHIPKSGDTGHMAIALSTPLKIHEGKYQLLVSDCSKLHHDKDTRIDSGVGSGEMILLTDGEGIISGYIWSSKRPKNKMTDVLCISFSDSLLK